MAQTIAISDGFLIDGRLVFVAIAVAMFGWTAGLTTATITLLTRIGLGGDGMVLGCSTILWTIGVAIAWRYLIRPRLTGFVGIFVLSLLTVTHMWIGFLLPPHLIGTYFFGTGPFIVAVHLVGVLMLGALLMRERLLVVEAETLRNAAATDPLTQTLNRRSARQLVDRLNKGPLEDNGRAVLMFDIDRFKTINDTYGHPVGDQILTNVTRRLRNCLRTSDVLCRLGGDEFTIILPNTSQKAARDIAERCRATISDQPFTIDDLVLTASTSIGLSWSPLPPGFEDHVSAADEALYEAKRAGRNRIFAGPPIVRSDAAGAAHGVFPEADLARAG